MKTALALLVLASAASAQEKLKWVKDHASALQEARKDRKYVVVHFSGPN